MQESFIVDIRLGSKYPSVNGKQKILIGEDDLITLPFSLSFPPVFFIFALNFWYAHYSLEIIRTGTTRSNFRTRLEQWITRKLSKIQFKMVLQDWWMLWGNFSIQWPTGNMILSCGVGKKKKKKNKKKKSLNNKRDSTISFVN